MNPWRGLGGLPREVWILSGATLLNRMGTMALPFLALYLTQSMGFTPARAGEALLVYGLGAVAAAPLGGHLSDRIGPLRVMRGALLLAGCIMASITLVQSWPLLLALVGLWALTAEGFRPASMAILTDLAPDDRRKAVFSLNRLAINLGMSIGPVLGGLLARHSFHALFWVDAATAAASALVLTLAARDTHARGGKAARAAHPFSALKDPRLAWFLVALFPVMVVFMQHASSMPVFLVRNLHFSAAFYGSLFTLNTGLIVLFEIRINLATAFWPRRRALMLGAALCAAGFGALAFTRGAVGIWGTVAVWTFGEMILLPALSDHVAHLAPHDRRGAYMGLYAMIGAGLSQSVGPWLGLFLLGHFGGALLWTAMAGLGVLSALGFARVVRDEPASAPAPA
ncbi:MAG TPA: MFS transporter [Holophagaceae bacterium]|nr:MFS transporter [Holophagaceae bacterium]